MSRRCLATWLTACVLLAVFPFAPAFGESRHGLAWNRSGLPAVFPLQVKTDSGHNYRLTLQDGARAVLAADIEGGTFFKVLVPPGQFILRFDYGTTWQGEAAGFGTGAKTGHFTLPDPLTFEIGPGSTRNGHVVDITGYVPGQAPEAGIASQRICQGLRYEPTWREPFPGEFIDGQLKDSEKTRLARDPRTAFTRSVPGLPEVFPSPYPTLDIRSRYCD